MNVELTPSEVMRAAELGCRRNIESLFSNRIEVNGQAKPWIDHIEGALAEEAFGKAMQIWIDPNLKRFGMPDVGEWHVRSTNYENGHLWLYPKETEGKFVLMVGKMHQWRIAGWIDAEQARQEKYFRSLRHDRPEKRYWIPQEDLRKI